MLSNRYICIAFSVCMVMSFFVFPVSAEEYEDYHEDIQFDDKSELVVETEIPVTETEIFLPETTVNEFEQQLTSYVTAGAIKIIGEYYGVEVPDVIAFKIAEVVQPLVKSDYSGISIAEYIAENIIHIVSENLGVAPDGFENAVREYTYDIFEENNPSSFNYFIPVISFLSFTSIICLLIWIGL